MRTPKQTDPQFKLRLTPEIDKAIESSAAKSGRTKNAEILFRLEASFERDRRIREQLSETAANQRRWAAEEADFQESLAPLDVATRRAYEAAANASKAAAFVDLILKGESLDLDRLRQEQPAAVAMAEAELSRLGKR